MKRLILIRHAKSNLNQPLVSDNERILNKTGINEAQLIVQYLHTNKLSTTTSWLFKKVESFQTPRIIWLIRLI